MTATTTATTIGIHAGPLFLLLLHWTVSASPTRHDLLVSPPRRRASLAVFVPLSCDSRYEYADTVARAVTVASRRFPSMAVTYQLYDSCDDSAMFSRLFRALNDDTVTAVVGPGNHVLCETAARLNSLRSKALFSWSCTDRLAYRSRGMRVNLWPQYSARASIKRHVFEINASRWLGVGYRELMNADVLTRAYKLVLYVCLVCLTLEPFMFSYISIYIYIYIYIYISYRNIDLIIKLIDFGTTYLSTRAMYILYHHLAVSIVTYYVILADSKISF